MTEVAVVPFAESCPLFRVAFSMFPLLLLLLAVPLLLELWFVPGGSDCLSADALGVLVLLGVTGEET